MPVNEVAQSGFDREAEVYERARPSYPVAAVDLMLESVGPVTTVLDLAAGTGKLTRLLVASGARVLAVEPVSGMRSQFSGAVPGVPLVAAVAERLPMCDGSFDLITCAQAFHWFDAEPALAELARVLRPQGRLGLIWNMRDERVSWVAELGRIMNSVGPKPYEENVDPADVVRASRLFDVEVHQVEWADELDRARLVQLVTSRSYVAALPTADREPILDAVRALVASFAEPFALPYVTDLVWCRRR